MIRFLHNQLLLVFIFSLSISGKAQQTLDEYIALAVQNNPELKVFQHRYSIGTEKVKESGTLPDPEVTLGGYISPLETRVGSRVMDMKLSQQLPWFGTLKTEKAASQNWSKVDLQQLRSQKEKLIYHVSQLYFELYYVQRQLQIEQKKIELIVQKEQHQLAMVQSGKTGLTTVLNTQVEKKMAENELEDLLDRQTVLKANMNLLLNRDAHQNIAIKNDFSPLIVHEKEAQLLQHIAQNNPELQTQQAVKEALLAQQTLVTKKGLPSFQVSLNYGAIQRRTAENIPQNGQDVLLSSVGVTLPLNRKKYTAQSKISALKVEQNQVETKAIENQIQTDLVTAIIQYKTAIRKVAMYKELVKKVEQTLEIYTASFSSSNENYNEILLTRIRLLEYQLAIEKAQKQQNIAVAQIDQLTATHP